MEAEFSTDFFSGLVEQGLRDIQYPQLAPRLYEPVKYTLEGGGKRLRPCLLLAAYTALSHQNPESVLDQALAIEVFHNFTLLHDDVMDNADLRRGRPTVHRRWDANAAILSGDAMLTLATQLLAKSNTDKLVPLLDSFNTMAQEIYQGQQLDMEYEKRDKVSVSAYIEMIRLKTSVLLATACGMGARLADAPEQQCRAFYDYGESLGLAFQLRDDWLDTFGDPAVFGKEIGGDIVNKKKTWLLITALDESDGELDDILAEDLSEHMLVSQVRRVYDRLNLSERCSVLASRYSDAAVSALDNLDIDQRARDYFIALARKAATRQH